MAVLGTADRPFVISYLGHVSRGRIIVALKDSQSRHWERLNDRDKLPPAIYPFSRTVGESFLCYSRTGGCDDTSLEIGCALENCG